MSKPVYRSLSVERHLDAARVDLFDAVVATTPSTDTLVADEPPWRRVTAVANDVVDTYEVCVAIVEASPHERIVSVSAVVGPEQAPAGVDAFLAQVRIDLDSRANAIVARAG